MSEGDALTLVAAPGRADVLVAAAGVAAAHLAIPHPVPDHDNIITCHQLWIMRTGPPGDAEQEALDVPRVTEVAGGDSLLDDGAVPQGRDSTRGGGGVVHQATRARLASIMVIRLCIQREYLPVCAVNPTKILEYIFHLWIDGMMFDTFVTLDGERN